MIELCFEYSSARCIWLYACIWQHVQMQWLSVRLWARWLWVRLWTKWLWVRVQLQSLKLSLIFPFFIFYILANALLLFYSCYFPKIDAFASTFSKTRPIFYHEKRLFLNIPHHKNCMNVYKKIFHVLQEWYILEFIKKFTGNEDDLW